MSSLWTLVWLLSDGWQVLDAPSWCGAWQSLCVVNNQPVGNPKRKVWWV
jgi:hypothetical protein